MDGLRARQFQDLKRQVAVWQQPHALEESPSRILPPAILSHFPQRRFPTRVIHECLVDCTSSFAAGIGFVFALAPALNRFQKPTAFISMKDFPYPPALLDFGINPSLLLHISCRPGKQLLSTLEECLRSEALGLVIGCCDKMDFTASRRLQLAAEKGSTGFIFRAERKTGLHSAAACRWKINSLPGSDEEKVPGLSHPRWEASLLKLRNGRPGRWILQYRGGQIFLETVSPQGITLPLGKTGS